MDAARRSDSRSRPSHLPTWLSSSGGVSAEQSVQPLTLPTPQPRGGAPPVAAHQRERQLPREAQPPHTHNESHPDYWLGAAAAIAPRAGGEPAVRSRASSRLGPRAASASVFAPAPAQEAGSRPAHFSERGKEAVRQRTTPVCFFVCSVSMEHLSFCFSLSLFSSLLFSCRSFLHSPLLNQLLVLLSQRSSHASVRVLLKKLKRIIGSKSNSIHSSSSEGRNDRARWRTDWAPSNLHRPAT